MTSFILTIALMFVLLVLKGFYSGSEIALVSSDKMKMMHKAKHGDKGAKLVLRLFKRPETLLATTLVGTNLATVGFTTMGTLMMIEFFGSRGELVAMAVFVPLLLIFGEIVPKSIMQQKADTVTQIIIYPLKWSLILFRPITIFFSSIARVFARLLGAEPGAGVLSIDREQLRAMVDMSKRAETVGKIDHAGLLARVLRFAETTVAQVMVPMAELPTISVETPTTSALQLMREKGYRRLVVFDNSINTVVGIFSATPWQMMDKSFVKRSLDQLTIEPMFLNPHQTIDEVLPLLWEERESELALGIVVDEFGSAIGVVSVEDIVEEVMGEITVDEATIGAPAHHRSGRRHQHVELDNGAMLLDGRMSLPEANELLGVELPAGAYYTLGGLLLSRVHHIPQVGEEFEISGYRIVVQQATRRGVDKLRVEQIGNTK